MVQAPHIVGHQTLKELDGFGPPEPDNGPGLQKARHGAGGAETILCGEKSRAVAGRIGPKGLEKERELDGTHFGEGRRRRAAARRVLCCGGGGDVFVHGRRKEETTRVASLCCRVSVR